MAARVRKAVFPVAGLGTRFLPATKAMPKEMLTVVDRPLIQHVVDEAREAGIEHFIFVTGRNKGVIEDHFDRQYELEQVLAERGKTVELEALNSDLPGPGTTSFTRQQEPLGLGHAVWCARELVGNEPFALLLPDVLVQTEGKGCLAQMLDAYAANGGNIIAVEPVPEDQAKNYGVVSLAGKGDGRVLPIDGMVEKPKPGTAPSNLTILGRYILQPEIFADSLRAGKGRGGRDPDHRRDARAAQAPALLRGEIRGADLRLRLQGRLPHRQCRLRARPPRPRRGFQGRNQEAGLAVQCNKAAVPFLGLIPMRQCGAPAWTVGC